MRVYLQIAKNLGVHASWLVPAFLLLVTLVICVHLACFHVLKMLILRQ
jgi:hypothetical protein